jgi:hypothetical protein
VVADVFGDYCPSRQKGRFPKQRLRGETVSDLPGEISIAERDSGSDGIRERRRILWSQPRGAPEFFEQPLGGCAVLEGQMKRRSSAEPESEELRIFELARSVDGPSAELQGCVKLSSPGEHGHLARSDI